MKKAKTGSRFKTELFTFLLSLLGALALVLFSVFNHGGGTDEFISQLHIVLLGGLAIYSLVLVFRVVFWILYKFVK